MSITIGREAVITTRGTSKLRIIVNRTNFLNFSREIGSVSNHSKILPEIILLVFNIAMRKKLKN